MSSSKALKKKISKRAKQKKNIQVKNSIRLKNAKLATLAEPGADQVATDSVIAPTADVASDTTTEAPAAAEVHS